VIASLAEHMGTQVRHLDAELLVGLPTLGLAFASFVAQNVGQPRFVPLGYSRKFWYGDALSEPVTSITSPEAGKWLRLDPNLLPLLKGRQVALTDDAISTGTTAIAAIRLLQKLEVKISGIIVAMKQTNYWKIPIQSLSTPLPVRAVYGSPMFQRCEDGWQPITKTQPEVP
jgi:adenine/guanine phosphoribosyltransferase-like PRPP-binding protein